MATLKLLGILDILSAIVLVLVSIGVLSHWRIAAVFSAYLILKGIAFRTDFVSYIDILIGVYVIIALFHPVTLITIISSVHLAIKGALSLA